MKIIQEDEDESQQPPITVTTVATGSLAQATDDTQRELFQQSSTPVVNRIGSDNHHPLNHTSCELARPKEEQPNRFNVHVSEAMNTQNASDRNPAQIILCNPDMHKAGSNQQAAAAAAEQAVNQPSGKQIRFSMLLPILDPQLDRDQAMQLLCLYARLESNCINKEEFLRHTRTLVGDHMLKMALCKLQQVQVPAARKNTQRASSSLQISDASALPADQIPRLVDRQSDSHGGQASHASNTSVTAINHQQQLQQKRMNLPQPSSPTYGNPGGNFHPSASANMGMPVPSYKQKSHDLHMRQGPVNPAMAPQSLVSSNPNAKSDSADQMNDQQYRSILSTPHGLEHGTGGPRSRKDNTFEEMSSRPGSITAQPERQNAAVVGAATANSSLTSGGNAKTPPKKPIAVQKKPWEAPVNPLSKKQKVVGAFADQSIEQLNDVTAVSGVNLRIPVRQYAQSASSSLQSVASILPADQRPRLLERQSGLHGVKASHVPNATAANRQLQQQQKQLQLQQQHSSTPEQEVKPQTQEPIPVVKRIGLSGCDNHHSLNQTSCELTRPKEEQTNRFNVHVSQAMNTQNASDRNPAQIIVRNPDMHKASNNQQTTAAALLDMLLPFVEPLLDRDQAVQVQTLYARFRRNSIDKEEYVRNMRTLVPDHMLQMAIYKLRQGQVPATRQNTQRVSSSLQPSDASALPANQTPRLLERQSDLHGGQASHASNANVSAINHQQPLQQKRMNLPQPSSPTYGNPGGNFHPSASASMCMPGPSYNQQRHDLQIRTGPVNDMKRLHREGHAHFTSNPALQQNSSHWQASMHKDQSLVSSNPNVKSDSADQMNGQLHRSHLSTPHGLGHATGGSGSSKEDSFEAMSSRPGSIKAQPERQNVATATAANSSLAFRADAKSPPKKPISVQKKPLEAPVNPLSKKQKVVGAFADQSVEQLNDVTAISGVNRRIPVRQNAQSASPSLQSVASTLPADQRPRLLERQSGSHGVKASHVPNANATNRPSVRPVPFPMLLQFLEPQLDKDYIERIQGLFARLRYLQNNTINRKEFLRHMGTRRRSYP